MAWLSHLPLNGKEMSEVVFKWSERGTGYRFDGFNALDMGEQ